MTTTEQHGATTLLRLEHGKANALDVEFLLEIERQLAAFEASDQRALVLTGQGRIFGAGVDLVRLLNDGEEYLDAFLEALTSTFRKLYSVEKPVVAAINGHAIAGGCVLAMACEYRVIADGRATIGVPELYVGVPFPAMALEIMLAGLAPHIADDLLFTGRLCNAHEAQQLGLVHRVVSEDTLIQEALTVAERLGSVLPATYRMSKQAMRSAVLRRVDTDYERYECAVRERWRSAEVRATMRAFVEATLGRRS